LEEQVNVCFSGKAKMRAKEELTNQVNDDLSTFSTPHEEQTALVNAQRLPPWIMVIRLASL